MPSRPLVALLLLLVAAPAAADEPEPPAAAPPQPSPSAYRDVSLGPVLTAGLGLGLIGDDLVGELGGETLALASLDDDHWLLQWDALVAFRGGVLANTTPYTSFLGASGRGYLELGNRLAPASAWSGYLAARLAINLQVMAHPGTALSSLDTLNTSDGFGGLTADGAVRVAGGASFLRADTSLLLVGFLQEAAIAPGVVLPGRAFTELGVSARYDLARSLTVFAEALGGLTPTAANDALHQTDQTLRLQVSGGLRKTFGNGLWLGVAASYTRDSDHVVYAQAGKSYDPASPGTTAVTLELGLTLWRMR
jgi:hypothetical protein